MNKIQKYLLEQNNDYYFYYKNKSRKIIPVECDELQKEAKNILNELFNEHIDKVPKKFRDNWDNVKLFHTKGNIEKAHSIMLDEKNGSYDLKNKLNHMTGKEWTIFSCSWFIFNALPTDLKEEKELCANSEDHPATYSPTMMENFIRFFTKEGMSVLDPFAGIGSTLVGCKRAGRIGYGVELNKKYYETILKRVPDFHENVINADSRNIKTFFEGKHFDFCISSPPYWDVLNRSTGNFEKKRLPKGLDVKYSEKEDDIGNIHDYEMFLNTLCEIYFEIYDLLNYGAYIVVIVKNIKKGGKLYPLAWDIARKLGEKYELKDEKIWIQDKIGLAPYGYPYSWTSNILHHYCLIFRKEV